MNPIDFENIVNNQPQAFLQRQYREMFVSHSDWQRVMDNRGEHCEVAVGGSGYSQWFFYHTVDDRLVFVIRSFSTNGDYWSWQMGQPPQPVEMEEHLFDIEVSPIQMNPEDDDNYDDLPDLIEDIDDQQHNRDKFNIFDN